MTTAALDEARASLGGQLEHVRMAEIQKRDKQKNLETLLSEVYGLWQHVKGALSVGSSLRVQHT